MCSINLHEIMLNKTYPEAGDVLYDMLADRIHDDGKIILNLEGVISLPSIFLNVSIGRFIQTYGVTMLRKKVLFIKISVSQAERLKEYISKIQ